MKRTADKVLSLDDDGYDSDKLSINYLKRTRLNPNCDKKYENFLKENGIVDPECSEPPELDSDIASSAATQPANIRAEPLETPERTLEDKQQDLDNASNSNTDIDDAKAKELKAWVLSETNRSLRSVKSKR